jgi:hypothetical protein
MEDDDVAGLQVVIVEEGLVDEDPVPDVEGRLH